MCEFDDQSNAIVRRGDEEVPGIAEEYHERHREDESSNAGGECMSIERDEDVLPGQCPGLAEESHDRSN